MAWNTCRFICRAWLRYVRRFPNCVAKAQNWDAVMAPELQAFAKYKGVYVGVPFNEHRHNWMWTSKKIIDRYGGKVPATWDDWFALADKMKADGVQPLAHGGQPWQEATLFDSVVVSTMRTRTRPVAGSTRS